MRKSMNSNYVLCTECRNLVNCPYNRLDTELICNKFIYSSSRQILTVGNIIRRDNKLVFQQQVLFDNEQL